MTSTETLASIYGQRLRLRVCGILSQQSSVLMVKHKGLGPRGTLWAPPGGGTNFGESIKESLIREFQEETGLKVSVGPFRCISEFLNRPLHAVELFFDVEKVTGEIKVGFDPEMDNADQIIEEVRFLTFNEIKAMDQAEIHHIFHGIDSIEKLRGLSGLIETG